MFSTKRIKQQIVPFCLFLILLISALMMNACNSSELSDSFEIINLDVGKADAAVVSISSKDGKVFGIIDTGTADSYSVIEDCLDKREINKLEFMILTHFDKDHIGSAVRLIDKYEVKSIFIPDYVNDKDFTAELLERLKGIEGSVTVKEEIMIKCGEAEIRIIPAKKPEEILGGKEDNIDNNMSLLTMITYGERKFLFTGDIEKKRVEQILESGENLSCDWIKYPHHGDYIKKYKELLELLGPEYAVISTSTERIAEEKTLDMLSELGIEKFDTTYGNVITKCDGEVIEVGTGTF